MSLPTVKPSLDEFRALAREHTVVPVWREELARFYPEAKIDILKSGNDFTTNKAPCIWLASYTQLRKHRALLDTTKFGYAVLDEGQFIKNPDAKVTQACFAIKTQHRLVLTGTPLENRQLDLWSIFRYLLPGLLGSRAAFESALIQNREGTMGRLRQQVAPFILRRTKSEVLTELPARTEIQLTAVLSKEERRVYEDARLWAVKNLTNLMDDADKDQRFQVLAALTKLRQLACHPRLVDKTWEPSSAKLDLFLETIDELRDGRHRARGACDTCSERNRQQKSQDHPRSLRMRLTSMDSKVSRMR